MKYYAIHTPANGTATAPSKQFSALGYLPDDQAKDYDRQVDGSIQNVVQFDDKSSFDSAMVTKDNNFFCRR